MSRSRCFGLLLALLLVVSGGLPGCSPAVQAQTEIEIGLVVYLQGDYVPHSGQPTLNAANLALEAVNAAGGLEVNGERYPVRLVVEGIENNPELAVAAVQRLINQKNVVVVIGPQFSSDAIPAAAIAQAAQVPLISPMASAPEVTQGRDYVFRIGFVNDVQGRAAARFAYENLGARRAAVLYDAADLYSREVAGVFELAFLELGGEALISETYITGDEDFSVQLARLAAEQPDVLFLPNYAEDALRQGQQARAAGLAAPLLGGDGWSLSALGGAPEFEGAYFTAQWSTQSPSPESQAFVTLYTETYQLTPNGSAAMTYDAVNLVLKAIQAQGSFAPQAIRDGLYALEPYPGIGGTIDFIDSGDPLKSVLILQIRDAQAAFFAAIEP